MTDDLKNKNKISARPLMPKPTLDEWIESAGKAPAPLEQVKFTYPWEDPSLREDVEKTILLPLIEPYMAKLEYISDYRKRRGLGTYSKRGIVRDLVEKGLDAILKEIL